jgi:hypothetical protein
MEVCDTGDERIDKKSKLSITDIIPYILYEIDPEDVCIRRLMASTHHAYGSTLWLKIRMESPIFVEAYILTIERSSTEKIDTIYTSYKKEKYADVPDNTDAHDQNIYYIPTPSSESISRSATFEGAHFTGAR